MQSDKVRTASSISEACLCDERVPLPASGFPILLCYTQLEGCASENFLRTIDFSCSFTLFTRRAPAASPLVTPLLQSFAGMVKWGRGGRGTTYHCSLYHCLADTRLAPYSQCFLPGANEPPSIPGSRRNIWLSGRSVREWSPQWITDGSSLARDSLPWLKSVGLFQHSRAESSCCAVSGSTPQTSRGQCCLILHIYLCSATGCQLWWLRW